NYIDVTKNARTHSNMGNLYFQEKNYYAAFKQYEIAYDLVADTKGGAAYLYNMAVCMKHLGNYKAAKIFLDEVIKKDYMNLTYYDALVDCYVALGSYETELKKYLSDSTNPYNRIVAGLIYMKTNRVREAKILFDEFVNENPKMMISDDVRIILRELSD
ncbi:tetratricopeptide repeat protein, partial [bacterium]|nr:tetratricopeptide repeat protein [bacterium]